MVPGYLITGALLLALAFAVVRIAEKTWFSPGAVLLLIYGVHCFLDPTLRFHGVHPRGFNPDTWTALSAFNAMCYGALVFGYMLPRLSLHRDKRLYLSGLSDRQGARRLALPAPRPRRMFDRAGFFIAASLCVLVVAALFVGLGFLGRFSLPKKLFTDYKPEYYEFLVSLYPILYVFVPALFVSAYFDRPGAATLRKCTAWLLVGVSALFVMAIFGRGMIFTIVLTIGIVYHFRYRRIDARHLMVAVSFVGLVTFAALLRRAQVGITELDLAAVEQLFASGRIVFFDFFVYTVMIFEGQPVLSHVIGIIDDSTDLFYGRTYLNTVLMRILPFEIPGLDLEPPPRIWYRVNSGFAFGSFGRGFSILAEAWMNFGRYGFVVFLFVGMLARWLSFKVYTTRNPVMLLWSAFVIVVLIVALRDDSLALFTRVVWYIVPLIVFRWVMLFLRQLSQHPEPGRTPAGFLQ